MSDAASTSPNTRQVVENARRDPTEGFAALLEKTESRLRVLLHFRLADGPWAGVDPDDVLQEVWAEALRSLDRFEYRGKGSLHRWLAGLLTNKVLHAKRAQARRPPPVAAVSPSARNAALYEAFTRVTTTASRDARRRESEERVRSVLGDLPERARRAVLLRVYEGLSGSEAAAIEGVDASTMSLRLRDALRACAARLRGEDAP